MGALSLQTNGVSLIPFGQEWTDMKNMAQILVQSGFLPKTVNSPQKAVAIMLKGRELRVPPMQAFANIYIINGVPTMKAELMLSLVRRDLPGARIIFKKMTTTECVIQAARPGEELTEFTFTISDAKAMDLLAKDNWKKMPKVLLKWRCISEVCRTLFSECLMGVSYMPEEINPDLRVNEQGDVIELFPQNTDVISESPATTIAEINKELAQENQAKRQDQLLDLLKQKIEALIRNGVPNDTLCKKLMVNDLDEMRDWEQKKLERALALLAEYSV